MPQHETLVLEGCKTLANLPMVYSDTPGFWMVLHGGSQCRLRRHRSTCRLAGGAGEGQFHQMPRSNRKCLLRAEHHIMSLGLQLFTYVQTNDYYKYAVCVCVCVTHTHLCIHILYIYIYSTHTHAHVAYRGIGRFFRPGRPSSRGGLLGKVWTKRDFSGLARTGSVLGCWLGV